MKLSQAKSHSNMNWGHTQIYTCIADDYRPEPWWTKILFIADTKGESDIEQFGFQDHGQIYRSNLKSSEHVSDEMTQKMNEMDNQRVVVHTFTKLEGVFSYLTPILKTSDIDSS